MNLLFDSNIVLAVVRFGVKETLQDWLNIHSESVFVSIATVGEVQSIAYQNAWGLSKIQYLNEFLQFVRVINITEVLVPAYMYIDAFSQKKHPEFSKYPFDSPRNMGKNDLWIAATASFLNLKLVTSDKDFGHLEGRFISLWHVDINELKS